jgi:hypothetical protein
VVLPELDDDVAVGVGGHRRIELRLLEHPHRVRVLTP